LKRFLAEMFTITLPSNFAPIILAFQPLMLTRTWQHAVVLLVGAILAPGKRTVSSVLRIMGRQREKQFQNYHRVLNRAVWDLRHGSAILLGLLIQRFAPRGRLLFGIDDTIERRWGPKIRARGIYRDPVRSSHSHLVKASGLRWVSLMLLVRVPWAQRVWALPVLSCLAPSERFYAGGKRQPKTLLDWARQQCFQLRRWLPERDLTVVADGSFAALEFLRQLHSVSIACITRLRLDARLYEPPPARRPGRAGRPSLKGARLPSLKTVLNDPKTQWQTATVPHWYGNTGKCIEFCFGTAIWYHGGLPPAAILWVLIRDPQGRFDPLSLLCTDPAAQPMEVIADYVCRWQMEVTFEEVRTHLGVETQRQWSDKAIARSTPVLLSLFSLVTLLASRLDRRKRLRLLSSSWYRKSLPTFSDTLAAVRRHFWEHAHLFISPAAAHTDKTPSPLLSFFAEALCYAA
jgi:DDE superfamily endonuclease